MANREGLHYPESPQDRGGDVDMEFIDQLSAEAVEYIHETAPKEVESAITNTDNVSQAIGATTYKIVKGLMDKHREQGMALEVDFNHAAAVGTEVVDMLVEVSERVQPNAIMNVQKVREDSLMYATVMHGEDLEGDERIKEESGVMLNAMVKDGTADEAFGYVNRRASEEGISTNDMMRQGNKMLTESAAGPEKKALGEAMNRGLMNQKQQGNTPPGFQGMAPPQARQPVQSNTPPGFQGLANPYKPSAHAFPETDEEIQGMVGTPAPLMGGG